MTAIFGFPPAICSNANDNGQTKDVPLASLLARAQRAIETSRQPLKNNRFDAPARSRRARILSRVTLLPLVLFIVANFLMSGCANIRIRMGQRPDIGALEKSLRIGESTSKDVMSVLGEPFGKGRIMLPIDPKPRTMWTYYYGEGDLQDARGVYLFVHFDEDRYDGYMWFASLPVAGGAAK